MTTAADLQAQVAAASQQLAAADLATLQTFLTLATADPKTPIGDVLSASTALPSLLGDPNRQAQITNAIRAWPGFLETIESMIAAANAVANPGS